VRLKPGSAPDQVLGDSRHDGVTVEDVVSERPLRVLLRVAPRSARTALELANTINENGLAEYAVPERFLPMELRSRHVPNDPLFARQWPLDNTGQGGHVTDADVDAPEAWRYTRGSSAVVIAVLDDGIEADHPDLAANVSDAGRDFTTLPPGLDPRPKTNADRHGTAVAGVAAARGDNAIGVTGMCPRCTILPIRVYGASNLGTAAAFRYAVEQGADIITNSWGYTREVSIAADAAVRDAIDTAAHDGRDGRGALVVFGMTNESVDNCQGPTIDISSLDSVLAVGVSNHNDEIGGSGFGDCMDLVAPSKPKRRTTIGVVTTDRTGLDGHSADDYDVRFGGTSAAAPLVAGIAGLLLSLNPELTRAGLERILEHTADKIDPDAAAYDAGGFSRKAGYGRVNAARALAPSVKIRLEPARVVAGEPFRVTVIASAPYGLESVSWFGLDTGMAALDEPHRRPIEGAAFHAATWSGIVIDRPGTFELGADARDARHANPVEHYPHEASRAEGIATVTITVLERGTPALSRELR
jgi:subtilisin family serine protease